MSFKDTQSYKELQADWRWIHSMDPEAAAAADQWVKEHPEEWKELEHMLYYSEANFHKRVAPDTLEDVDIKQPLSYNPEAFLPEEVRNAIYNDRRWFDRSKYLPEGSDEDSFMYLDTQIYDALHALTELQREILFRTIINGESTESVAQDKQCSSRNIRDMGKTLDRTGLFRWLLPYQLLPGGIQLFDPALHPQLGRRRLLLPALSAELGLRDILSRSGVTRLFAHGQDPPGG